jgi:mono/diheme cytochrome c family protein
MRGRQWKVLALGTIMATGLAACGGDQTADDAATGETPEATQPAGQQPAEAMNLPEGVTQEQVAQGRQLFSGQGACHACHNPQATGTQLAPDLTDDEWLNVSGRNMEEIVQLIHDGVQQPVEHPAPMPPMGGANLNDEQVEALAAYIVSLGQG